MQAAKKKTAGAETVDLATVLTDARTFAGSGRIVDKSLANWLGDSAMMDAKMLGRMLKKHVLCLSPEEAGLRVQAAFAALDEERIGSFFKRCAEDRVKRHEASKKA